MFFSNYYEPFVYFLFIAWICRKKERASTKENRMVNQALDRRGPRMLKPFDEMNSIASSLLLHLTSSMRFEGPLNGTHGTHHL